MKVIYDISRRTIVPDQQMPSGVVGFCSWQRLASLLGSNGERVTHLKIENDGVTFRVETGSPLDGD